VVQTLSFLVSIPGLSTMLISLNVEETRIEFVGGCRSEHMEQKSGGLEPDLHRMGREWEFEGQELRRVEAWSF